MSGGNGSKWDVVVVRGLVLDRCRCGIAVTHGGHHAVVVQIPNTVDDLLEKVHDRSAMLLYISSKRF